MREERIIRNDSTGIEDRTMYKIMLETVKSTGTKVKEDLLTDVMLEQIKYLHLAEILELRGIEYCKNLKTLIVANTEISDISPVACLQNLECLSLALNEIENIDPVRELTGLKRLYLGHNKIVNIEPIKDLVNLEYVSLRGNEIIDITPLAKLNKIIKLSLEQNEIKDISVLSQLTNLTSLDVSENDITDICALESVYNMEYLYLSFNDIDDVTPLIGMMNLKKLEIEGNNVTAADIDNNLFQEFVEDEEWLVKNGFMHEEEIEDSEEIEEFDILEKCKEIKSRIKDSAIISREIDTEVLPSKKSALMIGAGATVLTTALIYLARKKK